MSDNLATEKRLPGIPDRTLEKIIADAGGALTPYLEGKKARQRLTLGGQTFDAANNTELLTLVLRAVANG